MLAFVIRRLCIGVFLIFGVLTLTFFVTRLAPGDPIDILIGENPEVEPEDIAHIKHLYGLDKPLVVQYGYWLRNLVRNPDTGEWFDLGYSYTKKRKVKHILADTIQHTVVLTASALVLDFLVGILIGTIAAVKQYSLIDKVSTVLALFFYSMPAFWLGLMLIIVFAYAMPLLPGSGIRSIDYAELSGWGRFWDRVQHLILPCFALGIAAAASTARYMRASLLEVIRQDYIRTARAKGLSETVVIMKHAMRNGIINIITLCGLYLPFLLGGALVVEVIFAYPGMGRATFDAINQRDYPMIIGNTMVASSMVIAGSLLADVLYAVADPGFVMTEPATGGWSDWLPGLGLWRAGRRGAALCFAVPVLLYLAVVVVNLERFLLGFLYPLRWFFTTVEIREGGLGFTPGHLEDCLASLFLVVVLAVCGRLSRRSLARVRSGKQSRLDGLSQTQLAWREFKRHQLALAGLFLVGMLYSVAFLCPLLAPHDPQVGLDSVEGSLIPPLGRLTSVSRSNAQTLYTRAVEIRADHLLVRQGFESKLIRGELKRTPKLIQVSFEELRGGHPDQALGSVRYWLGTDTLGRDIVSRMIYGSRVSLTIGFVAVLIAVSLGTVIGAVAGYFGGLVDGTLMRFVDIVIAFPRLFLILMIIALFTPSVFVVVAVLGATSWMGVSRLVRGQFLTLKELDYAEAARAIGQTPGKIIFKHLLPNALAPVIVDATLRIGNTILIEATLSFLGLGDSSIPTWGQMVFNGKEAMLNGWWIATFSGLAIVFTVVAFNLVGDGLRDSLDPRLRT